MLYATGKATQVDSLPSCFNNQCVNPFCLQFMENPAFQNAATALLFRALPDPGAVLTISGRELMGVRKGKLHLYALHIFDNLTMTIWVALCGTRTPSRHQPSVVPTSFSSCSYMQSRRDTTTPKQEWSFSPWTYGLPSCRSRSPITENA